MFTKEERKRIEERAQERNRLRHEYQPRLGGFLCPVTGKTVQWVFTDHNKPGAYNLCEHCCTDEEAAKSKSLRELNNEAK